MPTLSEIINRRRPVYERKDSGGAVVSRHRLKVGDDQSVADRVTVAAFAQGYFRHNADILGAILYDPLPQPVTLAEMQAVLALFAEEVRREQADKEQPKAGTQEAHEEDIGQLFAVLQHHFGYPGAPWEALPEWQLASYAREVPRLQARAILHGVTANSLGGPHQSKKAAREAKRGIRRLQRTADGGQRRAKARKPTFEEHQLLLARLGISYQVSK